MIFIKELELSKYWRQLKKECDTKWFTAFSGKGEFTFQMCSQIPAWPSYLGFVYFVFPLEDIGTIPHGEDSSWSGQLEQQQKH